MNKTSIITLPLTPAKFTTKSPIIVSETSAILVMSCGGGMGGSHWKEYIVDFTPEKFTSTGLIFVTLFDGSRKMINLANVVTVKPTTIYKACVKNENDNFSHNYQEMYFTSDTMPVFVNKYLDRCGVNEIILHPFFEELFEQ